MDNTHHDIHIRPIDVNIERVDDHHIALNVNAPCGGCRLIATDALAAVLVAQVQILLRQNRLGKPLSVLFPEKQP